MSGQMPRSKVSSVAANRQKRCILLARNAHGTRTRNRRRKPYQKTGIINRHENRARPIRYRKPVPEKFGTKIVT